MSRMTGCRLKFWRQGTNDRIAEATARIFVPLSPERRIAKITPQQADLTGVNHFVLSAPEER